MIIVTFVLACLLINLSESSDDVQHDHIKIYVPYYVKIIKHTHTITKHIHHKEDGGKKYKVLGYTVGKPIAASPHLIHSEDNNDDHHDTYGHYNTDDHNSNYDNHDNNEHSDENNKEEIFKTHIGYLSGATQFTGNDHDNHIEYSDHFSGYQ